MEIVSIDDSYESLAIKGKREELLGQLREVFFFFNWKNVVCLNAKGQIYLVVREEDENTGDERMLTNSVKFLRRQERAVSEHRRVAGLHRRQEGYKSCHQEGQEC